MAPSPIACGQAPMHRVFAMLNGVQSCRKPIRPRPGSRSGRPGVRHKWPEQDRAPNDDRNKTAECLKDRALGTQRKNGGSQTTMGSTGRSRITVRFCAPGPHLCHQVAVRHRGHLRHNRHGLVRGIPKGRSTDRRKRQRHKQRRKDHPMNCRQNPHRVTLP